MRRNWRTLTMLALGAGFGVTMLGADALPRTSQTPNQTSSQTSTMDFPAGGTLRLTNSIGEVTVEGWDRPTLQITIVKSFKDSDRMRKGEAPSLDRVHVNTERKGDEVTVTTAVPRRAFPPGFILGGATRFNVDYEIKVPRNARLIVNHVAGEVNVAGVTGDIHVTARQGLIALRLPETAKYVVDSHSKIGQVTTDFASASGAAQKLFAHVGYGDVLILRQAQPPLTVALTAAK